MTDYTCRKDRKNMTSTYDPVSRIHGSFSTSGKAPGMADYYMCRIKENGKISISSDSALIHGNLSLTATEAIRNYSASRINGSFSLSETSAIADFTCSYDEKNMISTSDLVSVIHGNLSLSTAEDTTVYRTCRSTANEKTFIFGPSSTVNRNLSLSEAKAIADCTDRKIQNENISINSYPVPTINGKLSLSESALTRNNYYTCRSTEKERFSNGSYPVSTINGNISLSEPGFIANYTDRKDQKEKKISSFTSSGINGKLSELLTARNKLNTAMQKCQTLQEDLNKTRLHTIAQSIPTLELAFKPMRYHKKLAIDDLPLSIDKAIAPASAVLQVFDALHELEKSIFQDPQHDLPGYIGLISRLEEARSFLSENCPMAIEWLQEMVEVLSKNEEVIEEEKDGCMKRMCSQLETLQALQRNGEEALNLDGGLLSEALDRLEGEFQRILSMGSLPSINLDTSFSPSWSSYNLSTQTRRNLQLILQKLMAEPSGIRRERCLNMYTMARSKVIRTALKPLPLGYLHLMKAGTKLEWMNIEMHIVSWTKDIEIIVTRVCEAEYHLCSQVFEKELGYGDLFEETFSKISSGSGLLELLQFGEASVKSRDEPSKLFKLLDMFEAMNNLWPSFTKLFCSHGCRHLQQKTRDLLKMIVQGAHNILLELKVQIEKQRKVPPTIDGSLPKVSSFVLAYVKHLVGEFYGPIMTQILIIYESWKDNNNSNSNNNNNNNSDGNAILVKDNNATNVSKKNCDRPLSRAVVKIVNALVFNMLEWASSFKEEEPVLFHLFLCNNYWYLWVNFQASPELKAVVGETWIKDKKQEAEDHMSLYMKEGWEKIVHNLNVSTSTTFTGISRASTRELLKSKLKAFNIAFKDLYEKHMKWVVPDAKLKEKMCIKVVKCIVPSYRTYLQTYGPLLEQDGSKSKYEKYSAQDLERVLSGLFQGRS